MATSPGLYKQIEALLTQARAAASAAKRKQRVTLSAVTNGVTGQNMFLEEDEYPAYMTLGADFIAELRPVGVRETQLAQKIIDLNWRLNTMSAVENNLFHSSLAVNSAQADSKDDRTAGMCGKAATWSNDCEGPNAFEKLGRHEVRIQRSLFKISEEFERLQTARLQKGMDSFAQAECKAWIWYDHMLALHAHRLADLRAAERALGESPGSATSELATPAVSVTSVTELLCKIHADAPLRTPDEIATHTLLEELHEAAKAQEAASASVA